MQTTNKDLAKARLLLLVYSGYECRITSDSEWVLCKGVLYKKHIADELANEGHFEKYENNYFASVCRLKDDWMK